MRSGGGDLEVLRGEESKGKRRGEKGEGEKGLRGASREGMRTRDGMQASFGL